jgi:hypothetical protein
MLCDAACAEELAGKERVTTASGLQYQDLRVGTGPSPITGFQVGLSRGLALRPQLLQVGPARLGYTAPSVGCPKYRYYGLTLQHSEWVYDGQCSPAG